MNEYTGKVYTPRGQNVLTVGALEGEVSGPEVGEV